MPTDTPTEPAHPEPAHPEPAGPEPRVTTRPAVTYVAVTRALPMHRLHEIAEQLPVVIERALEHGLRLAGPPLLRYRVIDMARELVVEAGVPVAQDGPDVDGELRTRVLPAGRYATVVHVGAPETLAGATAALLDRAARAGLTFDARPGPDGEVWGCRIESYLTDPRDEPDRSRWETELAFRLAD